MIIGFSLHLDERLKHQCAMSGKHFSFVCDRHRALALVPITSNEAGIYFLKTMRLPHAHQHAIVAA